MSSAHTRVKGGGKIERQRERERQREVRARKINTKAHKIENDKRSAYNYTP
jgi:hypothetical protein